MQLNKDTETAWTKRYGEDYKQFIDQICDDNPDLIIPVARKSCKLFSSNADKLQKNNSSVLSKLFYEDYLDYKSFNSKNNENLKVAVFDDVTKRTFTLHEYRNRLVNRGFKDENIKTYAFVGSDELILNPSNTADPKAVIFKNRYLNNWKYQQYLSAQSNHLLQTNFQSDIDHLVLQTEIEDFSTEKFNMLIEHLNNYGYVYFLQEINGIKRFGIHFDKIPHIEILAEKLSLNLENDFAFKIKFVYEEKKQRLTCIPIYFPKLLVENDDTIFIDKFKNGERIFPIELPIHIRRRNKNLSIEENILTEKFFYQSVCLFFNALCGRYFFNSLKEKNIILHKCFTNFTIRDNDLKRYLGEDDANIIISNLNDFLLSNEKSYNEFDSVFQNMPFNEFLFPIKYDNGDGIHLILKYLRDNYLNEVQISYKGSLFKEQKPSFDATVQKLLEIGNNYHPLMFSTMVDELCDYGIIVPRTKLVDGNMWMRVYRSGENAPDSLSWNRTRAIISVCLETLGERKRVYFEKVLANFSFDFPPYTDVNIKGCRDNHSIISIPYKFGPINQTVHFDLFKSDNNTKAFKFFDINHLENKNKKFKNEYDYYSIYKEIIGYKVLDESQESNSIGDDLHDKHSYFLANIENSNFEPNQFIDSTFLTAYFSYFNELIESSHNIDYVMGLAITRNLDVYKHYVEYNIRYCLSQLNMFINAYKLSDSIEIKKLVGVLKTNVVSSNKKIEIGTKSKEIWQFAMNVANKKSAYKPIFYDGFLKTKNYKSDSLLEQYKICDSIINTTNSYNLTNDLLTFIIIVYKIRNKVASNEEIGQLKILIPTLNKIGISENQFFNEFNLNSTPESITLVEDSMLVHSIGNLKKQANDTINSNSEWFKPHVVKLSDLNYYFLEKNLYRDKQDILRAIKVCQITIDHINESQSESFKFKGFTFEEKHIFMYYENAFKLQFLFQLHSKTYTVEKSQYVSQN